MNYCDICHTELINPLMIQSLHGLDPDILNVILFTMHAINQHIPLCRKCETSVINLTREYIEHRDLSFIKKHYCGSKIGYLIMYASPYNPYHVSSLKITYKILVEDYFKNPMFRSMDHKYITSLEDNRHWIWKIMDNL